MSAAHLPGALDAVAPLLDHYGYLAVGALVMLEDFGVPAPGETILVAAAVYAGTGRMSVVAVAVVGFIAALVGDNIGFGIGRYGGRRAALRWGRYVWLTEQRLARAERTFHRHGGKIVTVARFVEGLRQLNGIIAGVSEMPWRRFLPFNALGAALWVGLWVSVGDVAGSHIDSVIHDIRRYEVYVAVAIGVLLLALVGRHVVRRRRGATGEPADAVDADGPQRERGGVPAYDDAS